METKSRISERWFFFELGKEIEKDEKKHLSPFLYRAQNLLSLLFLSTNITLSTVLVLAVCRTRVI